MRCVASDGSQSKHFIRLEQMPAKTGQDTDWGAEHSRPVLSVDGVTKEYVNLQTGQRVCALQGINFSVAHGEFVSIVGRSGCGKSTLLRLVAGLLKPTSGFISVDGQHVAGPGSDRGMVFQEYAIFPWKTALGNVEFSLLVRGVPAAERRERALHFLTMVGLGDAINRYPSELSGGMKQRVAVARSLCQQPRVLLMDEPFAAIDAVQRQQLQEELSRICVQTEMTGLFVTHSVDEAAFLSDRVIVLKQSPGTILAEMSIESRRPRTWKEVTESTRFNQLRAALLDEIHRGATIDSAEGG
jgi:NitT/TauT family transport system ATP-binding protein